METICDVPQRRIDLIEIEGGKSDASFSEKHIVQDAR
jgi:hypothetical protein